MPAVRDAPNAFIVSDLETLPSGVEFSAPASNGVALAPNNFFDSGIDVFQCVTDIETLSQITQTMFEQSLYVQTLSDYLTSAGLFIFDLFGD